MRVLTLPTIRALLRLSLNIQTSFVRQLYVQNFRNYRKSQYWPTVLKEMRIVARMKRLDTKGVIGVPQTIGSIPSFTASTRRQAWGEDVCTVIVDS